MTTLLDFLREARSRLGRAWDLLVTGQDPGCSVDELLTERCLRMDAEALVRELHATLGIIRATVERAP